MNNGFVGTGFKPVPTGGGDNNKQKTHWLSEIIRWFKTFSSRKINDYQNDFTFAWQRSFFDKIIRNDEQLNKTREYIINNPLKWEFDINNEKNFKKIFLQKKQVKWYNYQCKEYNYLQNK